MNIKPITATHPTAGWKTLPIVECDEPLVSLGAFSDYPQIATSGVYAGEHSNSPYPTMTLEGALITAFVRQSVAKRLAAASRALPEGHMLLVWDAYRTLAVQKALFDYYVAELEADGMPHRQAVVEAQQFVSIPSDDPTCPPPHNTGGAVDLTITRFSPNDWQEMRRLTNIVQATETAENWQEMYGAEMQRQQLIRQSTPLNMGTGFDEVKPQTATSFYERLLSPNKHEREIRDNRRLLWVVLTEAGFSNYEEEWWHFDLGNQFHATRTGKRAIYGAATLSEENGAHEKIRCRHYLGCVAIANGQQPQTKASLHQLYLFVSEVVTQTGNPWTTTHSRAAAI